MLVRLNSLSFYFSQFLDKPWLQYRFSIDKPEGESLKFSWDCGIPLVTKWAQAQRLNEPPAAAKLHYGDTRIEFRHGTSKGTIRPLPDGLSARR